MCRRASISILPVLAFVFLFHTSFSYGCIDTLRNEQGVIFVREWPQVPGVDYVKDQVVIRTRLNALILPPGATEAPLKDCIIQQELKQALKDAKAYYVKKVFPGASPDDTLRVLDDSTTVRVLDLSPVFKILLKPGSDVYYAMDLLCPVNDVIWAEPNSILEPFATPNDDLFDEYQWNLKDIGFGINAESAWNHTKGSPDVKIGIIGSGIDATPSHPDLPLYVKVIDGYNYNCPSCGWGDDGRHEGHETKVTGIAAALTNNGVPGIAGIAGGWNSGGDDVGAKVYSLRMTDANGIATATAMGDALHGGVNTFDCDVFNISWGNRYWSEARHEGVAYAQENRRIVVASMGNGGWDGGDPGVPCDFPCRRAYPAQYENSWVVAVGGYGQDGLRCQGTDQNPQNCRYYSNYGGEIDIVAPGTQVPTCSLDENYALAFGGTSAAAPHAAGVVALILSKRPGLWSEDVDWILKLTADDAGDPDYDPYHGWGRLDAGEAVAKVSTPFYKFYYYMGDYPIDDYNFIDSDPRWLFYGSGPLDGEYAAELYEVICTVSFPLSFIVLQGAWGKRWGYYYGILMETEGWSGADPNLQRGYCEVVPGSLTPGGCQIRTYFYRVEINGQWQWKPRPPTGLVRLSYAVWGYGLGHGPGEPKPGDSDRNISARFSTRSYPNPFNREVLIEYHLPVDSYVSIDIYDLLGKKVKSILSADQTDGSYRMIWDGTNSNGEYVDSGVYFYVLKAGRSTHTERMVLLK